MSMWKWPVWVVVMSLAFSAQGWAFDILQPLPSQVPVPKDNPQSKAKIALGERLYFDKRLSVTGTLSCNSCHNVMAGGQDDKPVSVGALGKSGRRNAPTVWNVAFQTVLYWDGRARSLEEQLHSHFLDDTVMAMPDADAVRDRLAKIPGYGDEFIKSIRDGAERFLAETVGVEKLLEAFPPVGGRLDIVSAASQGIVEHLKDGLFVIDD